MPVTVTKDKDAPAEEVGTQVKAPRLAIREQREQIVSKLYTDRLVPRWHKEFEDGGTRDVVVRYGPTRSAKVDSSLKKRSGDEHAQDEASLLIHADLLVDSCVGVFQVLDGDYDHKYAFCNDNDGNPVTDEMVPWPRFDKSLGSALGLTEYEMSLATNIVRSLYITDGDLIDASNRVSEWSTQANEDAEENFIRP